MKPAVCSWSLEPSSPADLVEKVQASGLDAVQLALEPIRVESIRRGVWSGEDCARFLEDAGIRIVSAMMETRGEDYSSLESIKRTGGLRLDEHWEANRSAARENAILARRLGVDLVTLHAGFLPHEREDRERAKMIERLRAVADIMAAHDVRLGLETGQETAATLAEVLGDLDRASVGVNFDPANMILYGKGDPIEALERLAPHILQLHIKDAVPADAPGIWGREVPVGSGAVDWPRFFEILAAERFEGNLVIEREAGGDRVADVRRAAALVSEESARCGLG